MHHKHHYTTTQDELAQQQYDTNTATLPAKHPARSDGAGAAAGESGRSQVIQLLHHLQRVPRHPYINVINTLQALEPSVEWCMHQWQAPPACPCTCHGSHARQRWCQSGSGPCRCHDSLPLTTPAVVQGCQQASWRISELKSNMRQLSASVEPAAACSVVSGVEREVGRGWAGRQVPIQLLRAPTRHTAKHQED